MSTEAPHLRAVLESPWVFSQFTLLDTSDFIKRLRERGAPIDTAGLRLLYKHSIAPPLIEITGNSTSSTFRVSDDPVRADSTFFSLAVAALGGRVRSPADAPFRRWIRFDSGTRKDPPHWANGLLYSHWQLLAAPEIRSVPQSMRAVAADELVARSRQLQRIARTLTAIEPAYWPAIEGDRIHIKNDWDNTWHEYRDSFSAAAEMARLGVSIPVIFEDAECLLGRARRLDPTGAWSTLIRRAPTRAWKTLTGDALLAIEHRAAAEMLIRFAQEAGGKSPPALTHEPERLSFREERFVDRDLSRLGVSPHPGVVLLAEGETEQLIFANVLDLLELRADPDVIRIVCMRGGSRDLTLLAAAVAAPILGEPRSDSYEMVRPPTRLVVAVDPDEGWDTPAQVERQRVALRRALRNVVEAQGASVEDSELDYLIEVHVWARGCFEFTHYSDIEIADALRRMNPDSVPGSFVDLVAQIGKVRTDGHDVRRVWRDWAIKPDKLELAKALWPVLETKIQAALSDPQAEMPQVADVAARAHQTAMSFSSGRFVIKKRDISSS